MIISFVNGMIGPSPDGPFFMPEMQLIRYPYKTHVYGQLVIPHDGQYTILWTIERPWLNNERNISCIPAGTYTTRFVPRSASGKYRRVYHLLDVPQRGGILIHNGNLVSHSKGCLILGTKTGNLAGKPAVLGSKVAMRKLVSIIGEEESQITIWGNQYA